MHLKSPQGGSVKWFDINFYFVLFFLFGLLWCFFHCDYVQNSITIGSRIEISPDYNRGIPWWILRLSVWKKLFLYWIHYSNRESRDHNLIVSWSIAVGFSLKSSTQTWTLKFRIQLKIVISFCFTSVVVVGGLSKSNLCRCGTYCSSSRSVLGSLVISTKTAANSVTTSQPWKVRVCYASKSTHSRRRTARQCSNHLVFRLPERYRHRAASITSHPLKKTCPGCSEKFLNLKNIQVDQTKLHAVI